jgi:3-methylfumaryl-CoA hydratase
MHESVKSNEICSLIMVRRVAAMLDLETDLFTEGAILPKGWHFFMLSGQTRKSELREDGFPGLGVPMPDLGLPRLLLGGRTVSYNGDILIGSVVEKISFVKNITEKTTKNGAMAIVTIQHELRSVLDSNPAIIETQTYILKEELGIRNQELGIKKNESSDTQNLLIPNCKFLIKIPDETLLFQYSAIGFNSHKIHLDRNYAQNVEGLPDLVVNGGLTTLLLTEFIRTNLGLKMTDIKVKHIAPLYCNRPLTLTAVESETGWKLMVYDNNNEVTVEMDASLK